ncbi:MAG: hypothetical protein V4584_14040 [Verrucomicrobiota bacterium]
MNFLRTGKLRFLYLLALAQLVGGPLVLLQVTVFCKLTLHEAPRMGVAKAAAEAWSSEDFQTVLATADIPGTDGRKAPPSPDGPKVKLEKAKLPVIPWQAAEWVVTDVSRHCKIADRARVWTPAWPQAPPGPPPRVG